MQETVNENLDQEKFEETKTTSYDGFTEDGFESLLGELQAQKKGAFVAEPVAVEKVASSKATSTANADATVRVETETLDRIMNMVGELVLLRNRLVNFDEEIGNEKMTSAVSNLGVVTTDLQASVIKIRM